MKNSILILKLKAIVITVLITMFYNNIYATTWDEPWQDKVVKEADYFIFAKIKSFDPIKGVKIDIIKTLGGDELKGEITIEDFYLLRVRSRSSGDGVEFDFEGIDKSYFFIKKNKDGKYCIATPTSGFDYLNKDKVYATYRHSYHQALVPIDIYEKTMSAIFSNYHNQPYNKQPIVDFIKKNISIKPAGFSDNEINTFYSQHVALETIYHLRLTGFYDQILPFLNDTSNFHNQVSAARALISNNTLLCKQELLKILLDTTRDNFVQVICIWTLSEFKPIEIKETLQSIAKSASEKDNGFGGNIMDPRVGTHFPDVKEALEELINSLH